MSNYFSDQNQLGKLWGWNVYVISEGGGEYVKIGTARSLLYRLDGLRNGNPRVLHIAKSWLLESRPAAFAVEKAALAACSGARLVGRDWVKCDAAAAIAAVEGAIVRLGVKLKEPGA